MIRSGVPKIELHVHLEATLRPDALFEMASRNRYALPVRDQVDLAELYRFRDFEHFLALWTAVTPAIQRYQDFRQVVVGYAAEAHAHGAAYIEGIFTPAERVSGGATWDEVLSGFCDGADESKELLGVEVRLTTDIPRNLGLDAALETARYAVKYRDPRCRRPGVGRARGGVPPGAFREGIPHGERGRCGIGPPRR